MRQRQSTAIALLLALLLLAGCGESSGSSSADPNETSDTTSVKGVIGFSALTLTNPFFQEIADNMQKEAQRYGYELAVVSAERDVNRQSDQIDDFIVKQVSAIVINPCDSQSIGQAIQRANKAGIPVFTNDIQYSGTVGEVISHIATDNYQGGQLAGQAMIDLLADAGGEIAILHFPQIESCQLRVQGFMKVIDQYNAQDGVAAIRVVATLDGGGVRDEGYNAAKDAIESNPELTAIFAINDPSALGARAAVEATDKADQIRIIGFDGQAIGREAILRGDIVCDPIQFPDRIGQTTIKMIIKHFAGESVPPQILIPTEIYDREDALKDPTLSSSGS